MKKIKLQFNLNDFPEELHSLIQGCSLYDSSCHSNAKVIYADSGFYIKIDDKGELQREAELLQHFYERGLGVKCVHYLSLEKDYLVTKSAIGEDASHWLQSPEKLCQLLAETLRHLHCQPIKNMPVSLRFERYLKSASDFNAGYYDESVQMKRYPIKNQQEAWDIMQANKHRLKTDTLIHGDFTLPNIIFHQEKFSTLIDFNLSGIGDKHIDLYWAIWSLEYNLNTDRYTDLFLDLYGRENFEEDLLRVIAAFEVFG